MSRLTNKRDRAVRLLTIQLVLRQYPNGIDIEHLAERCRVSKRTIYRDLNALESEMGVPIWEEGAKRGITEGYFLPPINFSLKEAINIFFAVRLLHKFSCQSNTCLSTTFLKLSTILPQCFRNQTNNTIEHIDNKPENLRKINNFDKLIESWISQRQVRILYKALKSEKPIEYLLDIYYIEPSFLTYSVHIIAYCHLNKKICGFGFEQIVGEVQVEPGTYIIPEHFSAMDYLNSVWDVSENDSIETIKLHFNPEASIIVKDVYWHSSQKIENLSDGSMILKLRLRNSESFRCWVREWGDLVKVIEPEILKSQIIENIRSTLGQYIFPFHDLNDDQWELIKNILPPAARTGHPRSDERNNINGIFWILRTGERWADMPRRYGSRSTCNSRLKMWKADGTWEKILRILQPK